MIGATTAHPGFGQLSRWLLRYARRRWLAMAVVLGVILLKIALQMLKPWPMKVLVDHVLGHKPMPAGLKAAVAGLPGSDAPYTMVLWCVVGTVGVFVIGAVLTTLSALAGISLGRRLAFDVAGDLFHHLQRLSLGFHHRRALGDSVRRVISDSNCASVLIKDALLPVLTSLLTLASMFAIMWHLNWPLTLASLTVVPFMLLVIRAYAGPMMGLSCRQQAIEGRVYTVVERTLASIPIVHAFTREEDADRQFVESTEASFAAALDATRVQLQFKFLIGLATAVGTAAILWVGTHQALSGQLTVGSMLVFLSYLGSLYAPLESLVYTSSTVQGATGSAGRVLEILQCQPEVQERPGALSLPRARGHVLIDDVTFGYEPGRAVLHGITVEAVCGEKIAIVGPSGAGKSTLVSLIPRFVDVWSGRVLLDGHDVRDLCLPDLRSNVAVVLQEPFLFPISVAENIGYGRPEATRAEIEAAARAANADTFIRRLPHGYDTVIGERGATLSGGERQRLAVARALLKDAPILILDEPTSAVDSQTEALLVEALRRLMHNRTTFIIAHRLSTVCDADRIVVIEDGRIVECGSHEALLKGGGSYRRMVELQTGRFRTRGPGERDEH